MTAGGPRATCKNMSKIPSKPEILDWIEQTPTLTAQRDIAKAFGTKGAARIDLKRVPRAL